MDSLLRVTWTVTPKTTPRVWRTCPRCAAARPFVSSGKFRVNAHKKRIDAWLIYLCAVCGRTWNLPIPERRTQREIDRDVFSALLENDAVLARSYAFDLLRLRRHADRVEEGAEVTVAKSSDGPTGATANRVVLSVAMPIFCRVRLDRLLAAGLGLSRNRLRQLHATGVLQVSPKAKAVLGRPTRNAQTIEIDLRQLAGLPDHVAAILKGAVDPTRTLFAIRNICRR